MEKISIDDFMHLAKNLADSLDKLKEGDNTLICLVSEIKNIYNNFIFWGLTPNEFNNAENIYILMQERASFLKKMQSNEK